MQCRIIDSVAPRINYMAPEAILSMAEAILSMAEACKISNTSNSQVDSNPVALRRLGTGKAAQSRCARSIMA